MLCIFSKRISQFRDRYNQDIQSSALATHRTTFVSKETFHFVGGFEMDFGSGAKIYGL